MDERQLARAVDRHSWEAIPPSGEGDGRFYRKAAPGAWPDDLTAEQVETVETITAPILNEFHGHLVN